ncbi:DUF3152 domain-containing protein [Micromonospora polyrhachis]|nr:DUF3152 domain-containing protein [Micromonospora polyrhachis]
MTHPHHPARSRPGAEPPAAPVPAFGWWLPIGPDPFRARRMRRRRRRTAVLAVLLIAAGLVGADLTRGGSPTRTPGRSTGDPTPLGRPTPLLGLPPFGSDLAGVPHNWPDPIDPSDAGSGVAPTGPVVGSAGPGGGPRDPGGEPGTGTGPPASGRPVSAPTADYPETGPGTFRYATGQPRVRGVAGPVRHYRVAVEDGTGQRAATFAAAVDVILGDSRGWTASRELRLRRVSGTSAADFTVYLATPATSERMCAAGGLQTERFTSCQVPGKVIINLARWLTGVPEYGAVLDVYRAYAVNHEVGHELGAGHEACPGEGRLAPVMQQQTYGLSGCRANGWPYPNGRRYAGPAVQ